MAVGKAIPDDGFEWRTLHPLSPVLRSGGLVVVMVVVLGQALYGFVSSSNLGQVMALITEAPLFTVILLILAGLFGLFLLLLLYSVVAYRFMGYALTEKSIVYKSGILFRTRREVNYSRIQSMDLIQPLLPRLFGLGKLRLESAGGTGSNVEIAFLTKTDCEKLRREISGLINGEKLEQQAGTGAHDPHASGLIEGVKRHLDAHETMDETDYEVFRASNSRLVGSALISTQFLATGLFIPVSVIGALVTTMLVGGPPSLLTLVLVLLPIGIPIFSVLWGMVSGQWGFTAAITRHGIRSYRGLTETNSQTLPPGRVHAVEIKQPPLWRLFDWWGARICAAGWGIGEDNGAKLSTLLPVGSRRDATLALWLIVPDLGVENPQQVLEAAMSEPGQLSGFTPIGEGAKILDPLAKHRRSSLITPTVTLIRDGYFTRTVRVVLHQHLQSVTLTQGWLQKRRGVATVNLDIVPGNFMTKIKHVPLEVAFQIRDELVERSRIEREKEPLEQWLQRLKPIV